MWQRRIVRLFAAAVFLTTAPPEAFAQASTGAIAGLVRDATGGVLPGVAVEASSPALIEKVRSAVTDGEGRYNIVDLRPGTYTVTFTLSGFAALKREGIELTTGFTANVNADMKVGSLEESVTVSGASPVVDVQNTRTQTVVPRDVLDALANSKTGPALAALVAAVTGPVDSVEGRADKTYSLSVHGGRGDATKSKFDGVPFNNFNGASGGTITFRPNLVDVQEVTFETGGFDGESETGGVQLNYVPREGGNRFTVYSFNEYTSNSLEGSNLTQQIRDRNLTAAVQTKRGFDYGIGIGGPIRKDKLWFYTAHRYWGYDWLPVTTYYNATQGSYLYTPDLSREAVAQSYTRDHSGRVTWQLTGKQKVSISETYQHNCGNCPTGFNATVAPEASPTGQSWPLSVTRGAWTYPLTSRLLLDVRAASTSHTKRWPYAAGVTEDTIGVNDTGLGLSYRSVNPSQFLTRYTGPDGSFDSHVDLNPSVSYVTGSHTFKAGFLFVRSHVGFDRRVNQSVYYTFRNQAPSAVTQYVSPIVVDEHVNSLALFTQDQWTRGKLTLNLGLRFDSMNGGADGQDRPASRFLGAQHFDGVTDKPNWKDISPRIGAAYDLFGTGKTAIKGGFGRYVTPMGSLVTDVSNPLETIVGQTTRTWNDSFFGAGDPRTGNFAPDCDLTNFATNAECGTIDNNRFGTVNTSRHYAPDAADGWGARGYEWHASVSVQRELWPGTALDVGYYRTWFGNIFVVNNLAVTPGDFGQYCVTTPVDAWDPLESTCRHASLSIL